MAGKKIAVLGAGHMGQSALRILLRHHPDEHAFPDGIIATSAAAVAGGAR